MRKSVYVLATLALTAGLLLSACAKPAPTTTAPAAPTAAPTQPAAPKASPTPIAKPAAGAPKYGGIFRPMSFPVATQMVPALALSTMAAVGYMYDALFVMDATTMTFAPQLALRYEMSPDAKSLTLTLRKGVKFHDGTEFNAQSVKWNIERRQKSAVGDYANVTSVTVIDDYTLRLSLSSYNTTMFTSFWFTGGQMYSPSAFEKMGQDWASQHAVGTGPFKQRSWQPDVVLSMERFDGYWQKGKPYLDRIDITYVADPTVAKMAFIKGDIDTVQTRTDSEVEDLRSKDYVPHADISTTKGYLPDSLNADSPWANRKVREAAEYAIDRETILKTFGFGVYKPAYQLSMVSYAHISDLPKRQFNPAKAKQLLAEAGYPNGFKNTITVRNTQPQAIQVAVASYLKDVGIDTEVKITTIPAIGNTLQTGWRGLVYDNVWERPDWLNTVNARMATTTALSKSMKRPAGWQETMDKALQALDQKTMAQHSQQLVRTAYDDVMWIPLLTDGSVGFWQPYVRMNEPQGGGLWLQNDPADFWLDK